MHLRRPAGFDQQLTLILTLPLTLTLALTLTLSLTLTRHKSRLDFERPDAAPPCTAYGTSEALTVEVGPGEG